MFSFLINVSLKSFVLQKTFVHFNQLLHFIVSIQHDIVFYESFLSFNVYFSLIVLSKKMSIHQIINIFFLL